MSVDGPTTPPTTPPATPPVRPLVLVRGNPTEEEVAALLAVLHGLAGTAADAAEEEAAPASEWAAPHRLVRETHRHGPGGWRASGLPR